MRETAPASLAPPALPSAPKPASRFLKREPVWVHAPSVASSSSGGDMRWRLSPAQLARVKAVSPSLRINVLLRPASDAVDAERERERDSVPVGFALLDLRQADVSLGQPLHAVDRWLPVHASAGAAAAGSGDGPAAGAAAAGLELRLRLRVHLVRHDLVPQPNPSPSSSSPTPTAATDDTAHTEGQPSASTASAERPPPRQRQLQLLGSGAKLTAPSSRSRESRGMSPTNDAIVIGEGKGTANLCSSRSFYSDSSVHRAQPAATTRCQ